MLVYKLPSLVLYDSPVWFCMTAQSGSVWQPSLVLYGSPVCCHMTAWSVTVCGSSWGQYIWQQPSQSQVKLTYHKVCHTVHTLVHEPAFTQSFILVFTVLLLSHQTLFILSMCIFHDWRTPCRQYVSLPYSLPLHFMSPYLCKVLSLSSLYFFYHTRHSSSCLYAFSMTGVLPADSTSVCHTVRHSTSWAHIYAKSCLCLHCPSYITPDTLHPVYVHFPWLAYSLQTVHWSAIQSATPLHEPIFTQSPISVFTVLLLSHQTLFILSMCIFHDWCTPCRQYVSLPYSLPLRYVHFP
jgi:hypothetical protein